MTTLLNRILTISALTLGTTSVVAASPAHKGASAKYQRGSALVLQAGPATKQGRKAMPAIRKQRRQAKRLATFDRNGNGAIEASERKAVRQQRFVQLDANQDGALTMPEMQRAQSQRRAAKKSQRLTKQSPMQRTKRAKRTPAYHTKQRVAKRSRRASTPTLAKRFSRFDANNNGKVTRSEFVQRKGKAQRRGNRKGKRS